MGGVWVVPAKDPLGHWANASFARVNREFAISITKT